MKFSDLHPDEKDIDEGPVFINRRSQGNAPLYPLSIIIALSFLLDNNKAHLFKKTSIRN